MELINFDKVIDPSIQLKFENKNPFCFQWSFRSLLIGSTGSGKSNLVMNLIFRWLKFDKLYIYCKDVSEDKYQHLIQFFKDVKDKVIEKIEIKIKKMEKKGLFLSEDQKNDIMDDIDKRCDILYISDEPGNFIPIDELDPQFQNLIIFDDYCTTSKKEQKPIEDIWIRGRKRNCSVLYLSQSFFDIPKVIRLNSEYIVLYRIKDASELNQIHRRYASYIHKDKFLKIYHEATEHKYDFLLLDEKTETDEMKIRKNFDSEFY